MNWKTGEASPWHAHHHASMYHAYILETHHCVSETQGERRFIHEICGLAKTQGRQKWLTLF